MSSIVSLFQQAQLAEAAYASFLDDAGQLITTDAQVKTALTTGGSTFSPIQATAFVAQWTVVNQKTKGVRDEFFLERQAHAVM